MIDAALVLAAGEGTRMRTGLPKVLHLLAGRPILDRVLDALSEVGFDRPSVVVGYGADRVEAIIGDRCHYIEQAEQLGTGHAAKAGLEHLPSDIGRVLVVYGADPVPADVYSRLLELQRETRATVAFTTALAEDAGALARVVRHDGEPVAVVEASELTEVQEAIREVNLSAYVFEANFLRRCVANLHPHEPKGEYYLTDLIASAAAEGERIAVLSIEGGGGILGINTLGELAEAGRNVYQATNQRLMEGGVSIVDTPSTLVDDRARIAAGTVIEPFTIISGAAQIGAGCSIGPSTRIVSSAIGDRCRVLASTVEDSVIDHDVSIGPYAHIRGGTRIGAGVEIGNYSEVKGSTVGAGTKMHHVGYLGDARVGAGVNIGAGTVTCNFDGKDKHQTIIGDGASIGSDTMLRAPVTVGEGAVTGAGSVVTHDVPPHTVVAGAPARPLHPRNGLEETPGRDRGAS